METQNDSKGMSGTIWGVIIVIGCLGFLALLAAIARMFGMNVPGFSS